jgi:subtilisin family serine protease
VLVGGSLAGAAPDPGNHEVSIGKHNEQLLTEAKAHGQRTVKVLVSTRKGAAAQGVDQLTKAGAKIEYRSDKVNYARVEVPVDNVKQLAALSGVSAIDVDDTIPIDDPKPEGISNPTPQPPPGPTTPRVNPYLPTGDTGAAQFVDAHPAWDGRGVTIGIVDTGVDVGHPALNTTSTGERKIVDWVAYTDGGFTNGVNNDNDPSWVLMTGSLPADYTAPTGAGPVKFGVFNERDPRLGGELGNDVNRDGNPAGSVGTFGVAWDQASNTVWVDTNQNKTFADDKPMTDYKVRFDQNAFGTDNPATPVSEAVPFVVQTDPADQSVNIGIVSGGHGSHVAGIASGNRLFDGTMSGAAPGAKIVSVRACLWVAGCTNHALIEGMIYAVEVAHVDVINMSIGGLPALNDGNTVRDQTYNNLIDEFGVQMFFSAGNDGAGLNTVGDPSVADKVVSVGSYIRKATWQRDYGSDTALEESLHGFSSRGPREDGGFKPTIVAPGAAISAVPTWQPGQPVTGTYPLPPGYALENGTSMAAPESTGAAALLLSAALATGVRHSPAQLRSAITSSARFLPGIQAYEQGNGLLTVDRAWELLQANISVADITATVPVSSVLSGALATPGVGTGIYDREGVAPGDNYTRDYTITRNSGPDAPQTFRVSWVGNDGTFSSPPTILLRKGFATKLKVHINPRTAGAHSAILNLDSPLTTGIEYQTLNTVVAAEDLTAANGFTIRHGGQIGRNQTTSYFVRVAPNTPTLKVDLQGGGSTPGAGQIRFLRFQPVGLHLEVNDSLTCYNPPVPGGSGCPQGDPASRVVSNPAAGVWEIVVEARRTSDTAFAPYTLVASALGAVISPNPDTIASVTRGTPLLRSYDLTNTFSTFSGKASGTALGSARIATPTIGDQAQQQFPLTITAGTTSLRATIGSASDPRADLDLGVFNCTTGTCVLAGSSTGSTAEESVTINNPAPGTWIVLVSAFRVPAGSTSYKYFDVFANPAFGSVAVSDASANRPAGTTWTVPATVTANTAPAAGRVLFGNVQVRTDANVLIGSADVIVQSVS